MVGLLAIVGVLEVLAGLGTFASAKSAIHETLGMLMIGFAFLTLALSAILHELQKQRRSTPAA
jgi:ABC-type amino acid transport system permease subunit